MSLEKVNRFVFKFLLMKLFASLIALSIVACVGCQQKETIQVLSLCIFEPVDPAKEATKGDLEALISYAATELNPASGVSAIERADVENIGYSIRYSAKGPLGSDARSLFNQGLPSAPKEVQDVAVGKIGPKTDDTYEISLYVGPRDGSDKADNFVKGTVTESSSGTLTLADGWIATWVTEVAME